MKVEIVAIGDELLIGQVVDTNSAWIGEALNNIGLDLNRINIISDKRNEILDTIRSVSERANVVLITGGLGPTNDDITKNTLCEYFDCKLVFNEQMYSNIEELLIRRNLQNNELNKQQAMVPECCSPILNKVGTAPGMWFEHNNVIYVSMPGVPSEMKYIMSEYVLPRLKELAKNTRVVHKTALVAGIPESTLAIKLSEWEHNLPSNIKLAYLPAAGRIRLRLSARGENLESLISTIDIEIEKLNSIIGKNLVTTNFSTLPNFIVDKLKNKKKTLATAESCTGGNISHIITSVSGSSEIFLGGIVSYSNQVKENLLGVDKSTLMQHGAVSQPVVEQMAIGALKSINSDYAVATSGIAGPSGGTKEKPVGTIWIAATDGTTTISKMHSFGPGREKNIERASEIALLLLNDLIENK